MQVVIVDSQTKHMADVPNKLSTSSNKGNLKTIMDSNKMHITLIVLVLLDALLSYISLAAGTYDTALPYVFTSDRTISGNLDTSVFKFTAIRSIFFALSMIIRILFTLEMVMRIYADSPCFGDLFSLGNILDASLILIALITKPCLPAREGLFVAPLILLPRLWRFKLLHESQLAALQAELTSKMKVQKEVLELHIQSIREENSHLHSKVHAHEEKLKLLTGENGFLVDERNATFSQLYAMHERTNVDAISK